MFFVWACLLVSIGCFAMNDVKRVPDAAKSENSAILSGRLKPGDTSPDFMAVDSTRRLVSLKSFKGKYVYVDLWATWCSPCVAQIPHLQKLEKLFEGKNIAFVSISCDDDMDEWLNYLRKHKMDGIQLNFDCNTRFRDAYGVTAIPRFILLDKKGKVINPNMTRPSDAKTEKTLKALKGL